MIRYIRNTAISLGVLSLFLGVFGHSNPYNIRNIQVKKTSLSAALAKDLALKEAKKQGLGVLLKKLVTAQDYAHLEDLDDDSVDFLIDSVQIVNEQLSNRGYRAHFSFEFNKSRIETFLRGLSIGFVSPPHKPILILPVLSDGAKSYLFERENIWFDLWKNHTLNNALVTFVVPYGDLRDIGLINAEDALIGAAHKLQSLVKKYKAEGVIVPHVSFQKDGAELSAQLTFQEFDLRGEKTAADIKPRNISEAVSGSAKQEVLKSLLGTSIESIQKVFRMQLHEDPVHRTIYIKVKTPTTKIYREYIQLLANSSMIHEIKPIELSKGDSILEIKTFFDGVKFIKYFGDRGYNFELADQGALPMYLQYQGESAEQK